MPIKGLSEIRRLPRVGKVRLGIKAISKNTGKEYPKQVDYFVVRDNDGITSPAMAGAFHEIYGDKPRELEIMFPLNDPERFFSQWYRRYGSGTGLICKGDGETAVEVDTTTGEMHERECNPQECEWAREGAERRYCRRVGNLMFLLPRVPGLGCWQLDTSSFNSIVNLNSSIDFIRAITNGRIAMIPLILRLGPREVQVNGKKKTVRVLSLALENLSLETLLKPPDLTTLYLPPATMEEAPDDLYPVNGFSEEKEEEHIEEPSFADAVSESIPEAEVREVELEGLTLQAYQDAIGRMAGILRDRGATTPEIEAFLRENLQGIVTPAKVKAVGARSRGWEPAKQERFT